jgi:hypothetical protein
MLSGPGKNLAAPLLPWAAPLPVGRRWLVLPPAQSPRRRCAWMPCRSYANRAALRLFEGTWDEIVGLPSRLSADDTVQEVRGQGRGAPGREGGCQKEGAERVAGSLGAHRPAALRAVTHLHQRHRS